MPKLTFTAEERDKAAKLLGLLVRWANWQARDEPATGLASLKEDDFLAEAEGAQLQGKGELTWQGKDLGKPALLVKASKAVLLTLCQLSGRGVQLSDRDIQHILNDYFRDQKAPNTDQITFLGILSDHRKLDKNGKTQDSPHFTLQLWSRKVAINEQKMKDLWEERYQELKGTELGNQPAASSGMSEDETDTIFAPDISVELPKIDVMPSPAIAELQIIPTRSMSPQASLVLERLGEYGWLQLYQDLLQAFAKTDEFESMLEVYVGVNPEVYSSPKKPHDNRMLDTVTGLNREGRIVELVQGAVAARPNSPYLQRWRAWLGQ